MKVSLLIPAFNEERLLPETLRHIQSAAAVFPSRGWESELIVCDNNSTDRTAELASAMGARVVFEPINQISRARNRAASVATGDWLLFIDADSRPCRELFAEVAEAMAGGGCLAGGSTVVFDATDLIARMCGRVWNLISRTTRSLAGSFIFCDTVVFREIGGFDETLFASEELDLSRRLRRKARESGRSIIILHRHPLITSARKLRLYSRGDYFWFLAKTVLSLGRTLRNAKDCPIWYDGRR